MEWVDNYYNIVNKISSQYTNKYSLSIDVRFMIKPKNIAEFHKEINKLKKFWFLQSSELMDYTYSPWCKIIIDTRYMKYRVTKI